MIVSALYIYPVKSLGGVSVQKARVTDRGLEHDRRWMLVDEHNVFITQRNLHSMALLRTGITEDRIEVFLHGDTANRVSFPARQAGGEFLRVDVWGDEVDALHVSPNVDAWFSGVLQKNVKLVYMPASSRRPVDPRYGSENDVTSFSDGYPILLIGQSSLNDLNQRLAEPVPMNRFRPNIVFEGGSPYLEDQVGRFSINGLEFQGVKPCARCVLTTVDQETGISGKEPLRTLASYRSVDSKVLFGQNVIARTMGEISVGNSIDFG